MRVITSGRTRPACSPGARAADGWRTAASALPFVLGAGAGCIEPGPLFPPDDNVADAGTRAVPGRAGGAPGGAPVALPAASAGGDAGPTAPDVGGPPSSDPAGPEDPEEPKEPVEPVGPADDCNDCLAGVCPETIERCDQTEGCAAIVACARASGCVQDECYCGDINVLLCATTGQANGPCRDVMLAAPGAHVPNLVTPNAGPASVAASDVGACRNTSDACREACES